MTFRYLCIRYWMTPGFVAEVCCTSNRPVTVTLNDPTRKLFAIRYLFPKIFYIYPGRFIELDTMKRNFFG